MQEGTLRGPEQRTTAKNLKNTSMSQGNHNILVQYFNTKLKLSVIPKPHHYSVKFRVNIVIGNLLMNGKSGHFHFRLHI